MKSGILAASVIAANAGMALSTPLKRADVAAPNATQILQFALTLEHLENTFYSEGLAKYNESDFVDAGFESWIYGRFKQIAQHEATHVETLTSALGNDSVAACNYSFPYTDPQSFVALSFMLESVGNSAYIGGARYLTSDPNALQIAGSILSMEGRHSGWIKSSADHSFTWSGAFDTPLDGNLVYSLASGFITSCPESNAQLPFTSYPNLTIAGADNLKAGSNVSVSYSNSSSDSERYLALFSGLQTSFVEIQDDKVALPDSLQGVVYAIVTSNNTIISNDTILAGPAIMQFPFNSSVSNP